MSLKKLMLKEIMTQICLECNNDIRDIKETLKARYHLPKGYDLSREIKDFQKIINNKTEEFAVSNYVDEFLRKFEVEIDEH